MKPNVEIEIEEIFNKKVKEYLDQEFEAWAKKADVRVRETSNVLWNEANEKKKFLVDQRKHMKIIENFLKNQNTLMAKIVKKLGTK